MDCSCSFALSPGTAGCVFSSPILPILTSITLSGVNGASQQVQYVNVGVTLQTAPWFFTTAPKKSFRVKGSRTLAAGGFFVSEFVTPSG